VPEPFEPGDELRVVHRHLAVEDKGAIERSERGHEFGKASGMVEAVSAYQPDGPGDLVGQYPPAVYLLLIDPALMVDRARYERRLHEGDNGEGHVASFAGRESTSVGGQERVREGEARDVGYRRLLSKRYSLRIHMTTEATIIERNPPSHQRLSALTTHHPLCGTAHRKGSKL
jgi:hypothetical protein